MSSKSVQNETEELESKIEELEELNLILNNEIERLIEESDSRKTENYELYNRIHDLQEYIGQLDNLFEEELKELEYSLGKDNIITNSFFRSEPQYSYEQGNSLKGIQASWITIKPHKETVMVNTSFSPNVDHNELVRQKLVHNAARAISEQILKELTGVDSDNNKV